MPNSQQELNGLKCHHCGGGTSNCEHSDDPFVLSPACHPSSGVQARYKDGVLSLHCAHPGCSLYVTSVHVAETRPPKSGRALSEDSN